MEEIFNKRLYEIKTRYRKLEKLQTELLDKEERLKLRTEELNHNETILKKELKDVKKIEGLSINALFFVIIGKKEERIEKERKEYLLASLIYNKSKDEVTFIENRINDILSEIDILGDIKSEYIKFLKEKEDYLINTNDEISKELIHINEKLCDFNNLLKELGEANTAGNRVLKNIEKIISKLHSAENWGTWDILGGGLIADLAKHSKIDDAKELVNHTQYLINNFTKELKDVNMFNDFKDTIQIGSLSTFADFFFDGLIADFFMQSKIENAISNILSKKNKLNLILDKITEEIVQKTLQRNILDSYRIKLIRTA